MMDTYCCLSPGGRHGGSRVSGRVAGLGAGAGAAASRGSLGMDGGVCWLARTAVTWTLTRVWVLDCHVKQMSSEGLQCDATWN